MADADARDEREDGPDDADGVGVPADAARAVRMRASALEIFARGTYYRGLVGETGGLSAREVDAQVTSLLGGKQPKAEPDEPRDDGGRR